MTPNEPPFRPSTELDNEWLTERPAGLRPFQIPDNLEGMNEFMTVIREEILASLVNGNPFGIFSSSFTPLPTEPTTPERKDLNLDDK